MPEIDLYLDKHDEVWLAKLILAKGARLVGDIRVAEPRYAEIADVDSFIAFRQNTRQFFVVHEGFSHLPLEMVRQGVDVFQYYIMPRNGGPALNFLCGGAKEQGSSINILPGGLQYYPTYWDQVSETNRLAPAAEVSFYRDLVKQIKTKYLRVRLRTRICWVGPNAVELVRSGAGLTGVDPSFLGSLSIR